MKMAENGDEGTDGLLGRMLIRDKNTAEEAIKSVADLIIIGTAAATSSLTFCLYHLATNPRQQLELSKEMLGVSTFEEVSRCSYLRACVQESLRYRATIFLCVCVRPDINSKIAQIKPTDAVFDAFA